MSLLSVSAPAGSPQAWAIRVVAAGLLALLLTVILLGWSSFREAETLSVPEYGQSPWHAFKLRESVGRTQAAARALLAGRGGAEELALQMELGLAQVSAVEQYLLNGDGDSIRMQTLLQRLRALLDGGLAELESASAQAQALAERLEQDLAALDPAMHQLVVDAHHHATQLRQLTRERLLDRLYGLAAVMSLLALSLVYLLVKSLAVQRQQHGLTEALQAANAELEQRVAQRTQDIEFERRLQADILDASPSAIAVLRLSDAALLYHNEQLLRSLDAGGAPPVTLPLEQLFVDADAAQQLTQAATGGLQVRDLELEVRAAHPFTALVHAQRVQIGREPALAVWLHDHTRRKQLEQELQRLAHTDMLTGLLNRRALLGRAEETLHAAHRHHRPFVLLLIDVDHFKRVNDGHGHPAGDQVLIELAQRMRAALRAIDFCGRFGGEEFAVLMPDTELEAAYRVAERMRERCAETPVLLASGQSLSITLSLGVAQWRAGEGIEALLARADAALYEAKRTGRNRVVQAR